MLGDRVRDFRRNCETDTYRTAGRGEDRRVDADHPAEHVKRRPAGIAAIDRGVDLDVVDKRLADVAAIGRNDPGRGGATQAKGIANRDHPVADARLGGVFEIDEGKRTPAALDPQHGQVGRLVTAYNLGLKLALILEDDLDSLRVLDHVVVCDDVAISRNEEPRTRGLLRGPTRQAGPGGSLAIAIRIFAALRSARAAAERKAG